MCLERQFAPNPRSNLNIAEDTSDECEEYLRFPITDQSEPASVEKRKDFQHFGCEMPPDRTVSRTLLSRSLRITESVIEQFNAFLRHFYFPRRKYSGGRTISVAWQVPRTCRESPFN